MGLYAAPGALLLYAALGSSRVLVMGPMAAAAALSAATVADLAPVGDERFAALTAGLAIAAGVAALIAGLLRLGFVAEFISRTGLPASGSRSAMRCKAQAPLSLRQAGASASAELVSLRTTGRRLEAVAAPGSLR